MGIFGGGIFPSGGGGGGGSTSGTYTNATPSTETVGGISSGTTFDAVSHNDMWNNALYTYQSPTFSSFSISGQTTTLEVGDSTGSDPTFLWNTTNSANVEADSLVIRDVTGAADLATGLANDGTEAVVLAAIQKTSATSHQFRITGTNTQAGTFNRSLTINWRWLLFYGESASSTLDEAAIEALRVSNLDTGYSGNYSFNAGDYKYLCYPTSFGTATTFKDEQGFDVAMSPTVDVVSVTNSNGIATNYNVHRTLNPMAGSIVITVS